MTLSIFLPVGYQYGLFSFWNNHELHSAASWQFLPFIRFQINFVNNLDSINVKDIVHAKIQRVITAITAFFLKIGKHI